MNPIIKIETLICGEDNGAIFEEHGTAPFCKFIFPDTKPYKTEFMTRYGIIEITIRAKMLSPEPREAKA